MGFLFDDEDESTESAATESLPDWYHIKERRIYDGDGNQVSLKYHDIDFPEAKLGATRVTLINQNGFFVPDEKQFAWQKGLSEAVAGNYRTVPKGYLEAVYDLHGSCPESVKHGSRGVEEALRRRGGSELYGGTRIGRNAREYSRSTQNKSQEILDNTTEKVEKDPADMEIDTDKFIVLLKAYVSGSLVENSSSWLSYEGVYDNMLNILEEYIEPSNPVPSLRYAESVIEFSIPTAEYQKIQQCSEIEPKYVDEDEPLPQVERRLERELVYD